MRAKGPRPTISRRASYDRTQRTSSGVSDAASVGSTTSVHTNRLIESPMSSLLQIHSTPLMTYVCPSTMSSPLMWGRRPCWTRGSGTSHRRGIGRRAGTRHDSSLSLTLARWPGAVRAIGGAVAYPDIRLCGVRVVAATVAETPAGRQLVVCSCGARTLAHRRLHPEEYGEKERLKAERRRERQTGGGL